jgi:glycosidase
MMKNGTRDNARTPMQWSGESGAGFTSGKPWLKINGNSKYINVLNIKYVMLYYIQLYKLCYIYF